MKTVFLLVVLSLPPQAPPIVHGPAQAPPITQIKKVVFQKEVRHEAILPPTFQRPVFYRQPVIRQQSFTPRFSRGRSASC